MGDDLGLLFDGLESADVYQLLYQLMVALNLGSGSVSIPVMHRLVSA